MSQNSTKVQECKVCLGPHDEEIHNATVSVKLWFAGQVTKHFEENIVPDPDVNFSGTAA